MESNCSDHTCKFRHTTNLSINFLVRHFRGGSLIINDDATDPAIEQTYHFLKTQYKIDDCKCSNCSRTSNSAVAPTDPWFETKDPRQAKVRAILTDKIDNFFRMSDDERQTYVDQAIAYLNEWESIHPICEMIVMQMYLQNYWMLTTAQCD